jgi:K+-sensing histidine kinase KdpD
MINEKYPRLLLKKVYFTSIVLLTIIIITIMGYSYYLGNRMATVYTPQIDAAMEIKLETTIAHLWFEEILSGDRHENMEAVWEHIEQADWYANAMLEGGENQEGIFIPLDAVYLRNDIKEVRNKIEEFKNITQERYARIETAVAGTDIDEHYDAVFRDFINQADKVETELQKIIIQEHSYFRKIQFALILFVIIISILLVIVFNRFEKHRLHDYFSIKKMNKDLEKEIFERKQADEKIKNVNQQLINKNKELSQFTYIASHDLQEPLNTIISFSQLLKDGYYNQLEGVGQRSVEIIDISTKRMKSLIVGLLEYSRIGKNLELGKI